MILHTRTERVYVDDNRYREFVIVEMLESEVRFLKMIPWAAWVVGALLGFMAGAAVVFIQWHAALGLPA